MESNFYYSAIENKFYPSEYYSRYVDAGTWPADAVPVTDDVYFEFSGLQPEGKTRCAVDGVPTWVDVIVDIDTLRKDADRERSVKIAIANEVINQNQWPSKLALGRLGKEEITKFNAWLDYQEQLESMDVSNPVSIDWPTPPDA
ncbi:tail fiber assembly protein [Plesiomonas shigelloides]|uniref:Putative tail fiber assembly protein n=1 Tax=Plesiomonas shigelloides 302-73 TaxID=1315976 RepID=R8ANC1_PLESH|nr:tail fiber assembly protein [Plesiomonas shigelloides]EON87810.1 putative tail fiber assembly protein [Plesiomonas shigelloides 302-73]